MMGSFFQNLFSGGGAQTISHEALKAGLLEASIVLVDVRETKEYSSGHVSGSISLPLSVFDARKITRQPEQKVVFICLAGVRSLRAIKQAEAAGLQGVTHYAGGVKGWVGAGETLV